jgi:hypothetical protein
MANLVGTSGDPGVAGVHGESQQFNGVLGVTKADGHSGVAGVSDEGVGNGVYGRSKNANGVVGYSSAIGHSGVAGVNEEGDGYGVYGRSKSSYGVVGTTEKSSANLTQSAGVWGRNDGRGCVVLATGTTALIVEGTGGGIAASASEPNSTGIECVGARYGIAARGGWDGGAAILGENINGHAGYFIGKVRVTGELEKAGGGFKIDHPLDPANKYLSHSFVESPNRTNIYDGTSTLDANGEAVVVLPEWFEQLNDNFRYQLTAIGSPAPNLHIATKIKDNRFQISGGEPGLEICWQVTGTRKDPWTLNNPLVVEDNKNDIERGNYLHPTLYGQSESSTIGRRLAPHTLRTDSEP